MKPMNCYIQNNFDMFFALKKPMCYTSVKSSKKSIDNKSIKFINRK